FQAEDGIRDATVTGVQTCALPILSRLVARLEEGYQAWQKRDLAAERIVYLYLDAIYLKVRSGGKVVSLPVLVALGVRAGGEKVQIGRASCRERGEGEGGRVALVSG